MIAAETPGAGGRTDRRAPSGRLAAIPVAAVLAFLAQTGVAGLHQAAGVLLVLGLVWAGYGIVIGLFPGLDAVPAVILAAMTSACLVALLVVAVYAAGVTVTPRHMVITIAAGASVLVIVGEVLGRVPRMRWWASRRTVTVAVLTAAACGLLVVDAGAVTARLAPRSVAAPYSAFGFAGAAARWSQQLSVYPGQVLAIPLQIVNHTGQPARFVVQSQISGVRHTLTSVEVAKSATWTGTFPVTMPSTGCPSRLVFLARSAATTETLDVWLQWNNPSCA